jgi:hypothetical protein
MNIEKYIKKVNQFIKEVNYIIFFIVYVVICSIIVMISELFNTLFINSDIMIRFELGLPLISQLILTYIIYRKNHEIKIIKFLFIVAFFYTLVCGMLSLYELYFTYPSFADNLFYYVSNAQIVFQFILVLLLLICLIAKQVDKLVVIKSLLMVAFTVLMMIIAQSDNKFFDSDLGFWIIIITLFINIFNPVMLYILSYIAKGKLFIKDI